MTQKPEGRAFFLAPSLGSATGHHSPVARNYEKLCSDLQCYFIGNRLSAHAGELRRYEGIFRYTTEDAHRVGRYGSSWAANARLVSMARAIRRFSGQNKQANPNSATTLDSTGKRRAALDNLGAVEVLDSVLHNHRCSSNDHVVALALDPALLYALWERRDYWSSGAAPALHLIAVYEQPGTSLMDPGSHLAKIFQLLCSSERPPRVYAETPRQAAWLSSTLNHEVTFVIPPTRLEELEENKGQTRVISVLGAGRVDKGFAQLIDIVDATRAQAPHISFRIQRSADRALFRINRCLEDRPNVVLLESDLNADHYERELKLSHAVLLPYQREAFAVRGSGVLIDALVAARPVICRSGASFDWAVAQKNGFLCSSSAEFADAVVAMDIRYKEFAIRSREVSAEIVGQLRHGRLVSFLKSQPGD